MKPCLLCSQPTQTLERIHTPCLYAYLFPVPALVGNEVARNV
jgi:hypothetical protein